MGRGTGRRSSDRDVPPGTAHPLHPEAMSTVCEKLEAAPDPEGSIEILNMFWDPGDLTPDGATANRVPPLLVYADLVALADPRGLDIARKIRKEHLG